MQTLRDLIRGFLEELLQREPFKAFVRSILGTVPAFDPDAEQPELTDAQRRWITEVLEELNSESPTR